MPVVDLSDLKLALGVTTTTDDYEMQLKLDAAEAEYAEHVRPLPGTYTESLSLPTILPRGVTEASASSGGQPIAVTLARSGLLTGWSVGEVDVTYTVGPVPANHYEAIVADVAEYWDRTQRTGGSAGRPGYDQPGIDVPAGGRPVTMYPRIRALAGPAIA